MKFVGMMVVIVTVMGVDGMHVERVDMVMMIVVSLVDGNAGCYNPDFTMARTAYVMTDPDEFFYR